DGPVATALAAALTGNTNLAQSAAQRDARLRVGRDIVHQRRPLAVGHDRLGAPDELRQLDDGLQAGHAPLFIRQWRIRQWRIAVALDPRPPIGSHRPMIATARLSSYQPLPLPGWKTAS